MPHPHFPIHHTFGPLVTKEQWSKAFRFQFKFGRWVEGQEIEELRSALSHSFGMSASLFFSGRDALLSALRALELKSGDEVILQAFTCAVVPNAIHASGAVPVYCDIDPETLNLDLNKIQSHITNRTKAIICQHTFGIPVDTGRLRAICDKRQLILIEDCAHVIPDSEGYDQMHLMRTPSATEKIGRHGDVLLFSFGRDKAVSGVTGGAVLTRDGEIGKRIAEMEKSADPVSRYQVLNLIDYPIRYRFAKWLWRLPFGSVIAKSYLKWISTLGFLPRVLSKSEKEGKMDILPRRIPNACAALALEQLSSIGKLNDQRRKITSIYSEAARAGDWRVPESALESPALQKFPVYARDAEKLRSDLKGEQIYLDDGWCSAIVNPKSVDQEAMGYAAGSCPVAEDVVRHIINLPTHPTVKEEQAKYLVMALRSGLG